VQTDEDKARGTAEVIDFSAGLGLTTLHDMGGLPGLGSYKYSLELWRRGDLNIRIRFFFWSGGDTGISSMQARITNNLNQLGDELYRPIGVGERINTNSTSPLFPQACSFAAANDWTLTQHSLSTTEIPFQIAALHALKLHTSGSTCVSFDNDKLGTIEVGKLADLVVLSRRPR
jgi:predicted amidohydrolase YtcJ